MLKSRLEQLKYKVDDGVKVNFTPTEDDLTAMKVYARSVVQRIK